MMMITIQTWFRVSLPRPNNDDEETWAGVSPANASALPVGTSSGVGQRELDMAVRFICF